MAFLWDLLMRNRICSVNSMPVACTPGSKQIVRVSLISSYFIFGLFIDLTYCFLIGCNDIVIWYWLTVFTLSISTENDGDNFFTYNPKRMRSLSSIIFIVVAETTPHFWSSLSTLMDRTSSHLIKLVCVSPPSGGLTST